MLLFKKVKLIDAGAAAPSQGRRAMLTAVFQLSSPSVYQSDTTYSSVHKLMITDCRQLMFTSVRL